MRVLIPAKKIHSEVTEDFCEVYVASVAVLLFDYAISFTAADKTNEVMVYTSAMMRRRTGDMTVW
jgi:hypothetical protein